MRQIGNNRRSLLWIVRADVLRHLDLLIGQDWEGGVQFGIGAVVGQDDCSQIAGKYSGNGNTADIGLDWQRDFGEVYHAAVVFGVEE